jgi:hypothetical protein
MNKDDREAHNHFINLTSEDLLDKCITFLLHIGIIVKHEKLPDDSFLPGLSIKEGCILIDREHLKYPGDILHEAGHIAVVPADERKSLTAAAIAQRNSREAEEMMAIAWSYAACIHLNMDPHFVFHDDGYKGGGSYIAENFKEKRYFGLPMLQWIGLTADETKAAEKNILPYPHMIKWLRD